MYTREQKEKALAIYDATQSIAEVIRRLGYPSKQALYTWIANRDKPWQKPNGFRGVNTAEHPRHPSVNLKFSAIREPADKILDRGKGRDYVHKGAKGKGTCNI